MLALLLLVVIFAVGCVLWFLREAMRNERLAIREKLGEAYRGNLFFIQSQIQDRWKHNLALLDEPEAPPQRHFQRAVSEGVADSLICLDQAGLVSYPKQARPGKVSPQAAALLDQVRGFNRQGNPRALARFVLQNFSEAQIDTDEQGRVISASAELMALEALRVANDSDFQKIASRLRQRLQDYNGESMPSSQRRFIMRSLSQLDPNIPFPTLAAEDLAAEFVESTKVIEPKAGLQLTELHDVWSVMTPGGKAVALFTKAGLKKRLGSPILPLPSGVRLGVEAPGEEDSLNTSVLARTMVGPQLPGWQLTLSVDDRALFDSESARRVKFLVLIACLVIAAISALSLFIARSFGRQVKLARLKNDLVAMVSHELKTPLTAMRALVETLLDSERLEEKVTREYLEMIALENSRLSRLIENFLTFSRIERNRLALHFERVNPREVVEAAIMAFGDRARAPGCRLESTVEENLPPLRVDLDALTTALLNLLDNAWKYTDAEKRIQIRCRLESGMVCFEVSDNGIGIAPREMRKIFHPFYQSDQRLSRTVGGCGLGLGIVKAIIQAHGGEVFATSQPGRGSTFTIKIPAIIQPNL